MSVLNEGRNEIRVNNSDAKCLLENWVEERKVQALYPSEKSGKSLNKAEDFRRGHHGIFTKDTDAKIENLTTVRASYVPPVKSEVRQRGKKEVFMEQMFYEQATNEVDSLFNPPMEIQEYKSVMMKDYNKDDFVSVKPQPTVAHNYKTEQPVTFWSEHKNRITGVSQVKTDSAFRKNDAFSKPIDEYWNEPEPFETENYPKM